MEHTVAMEMRLARIPWEVTSVLVTSRVFTAMDGRVTITIRVGMSPAPSMPRVSKMRTKRRITNALVKELVKIK